MKKLTGESMNITEENLKSMQQLFPEAFEEGKIDFDVLRQLLGDFVDDEQERYSFKWNGKGKALRLSQTPSMGTLRPCKEESKDWDNTENLYIEGDNLEVLKLLQKSYYGKVKMIYIDPPYNTGNDFVYKDDFRDNIENYKELTGQVNDDGDKIATNTESNGRFHTNWLNMMYPRLRLARNLLTDDGVVFISIDDNEITNLSKICDELFNHDNHMVTFVWKSKGSGAYDSAQFKTEHEYILVYAKNKNIVQANKQPYDTGSDSAYSLIDKRFPVAGKYKRQALSMGTLSYSSSLDYPVTCPDGSILYPGGFFGPPYAWRYSKQKMEKAIAEGFAEFVETKNGWSLFSKQYERMDGNGNVIVRDKPYTSMDIEAMNRNGTELIKKLFNKNRVFDYPKPLDVPLFLMKTIKTEKSIILDFFGGSSTTAHAVMQLNAEDGGHRKFIMIQLPESSNEKSEAYKAGYKNICEIGKERIRRAGDKIKAEAGDKAADLDIGFKVFKLDSSNLQKWNPQPDDLVMTLQQATDNFLPDRTEQDVLYEIMLKMGLDLTCQIEEEQAAGETVYIIGGGALMICLGRNITIAVAEAVVKLHAEYESELWQVVFRDTGFASDMDKTNVKETLKAAGLDEDSFVCV